MDKAVRLTTVVGCIGAGVFGVLFADFGEREHVFSPVRRTFGLLTSAVTPEAPGRPDSIDSVQGGVEDGTEPTLSDPSSLVAESSLPPPADQGSAPVIESQD